MSMCDIIMFIYKCPAPITPLRIFGYRPGAFTQWLVVDLNFTSVITEECSESDYLTWTPTGTQVGVVSGCHCMASGTVDYNTTFRSVNLDLKFSGTT